MFKMNIPVYPFVCTQNNERDNMPQHQSLGWYQVKLTPHPLADKLQMRPYINLLLM